MAEAQVERRLAAIPAADIVGYSRMMGEDEAGTLAVLKSQRSELIEPTIAKHHGRLVKLMGDGILAEFGRVVEAAFCATETSARWRCAIALQSRATECSSGGL